MRLKVCLLSFLISIPFWWCINILGLNLEDFFFSLEFTRNPYLLAARADQELLTIKLKNIRNVQRQRLTALDVQSGIEAKAVIAVRYGRGQKGEKGKKIILQKNIYQKLPIASLTKLMTALVVLENLDLAQEIEISQEAVAQEENIGNFNTGEKFLAKDLLSSMLIESSNDAAFALSQAVDRDSFPALMNLTAERIGLKNTYFANPTGLDPDDEKGPYNYSAAEDLTKLTIYLLENQSFILDVLSKPTTEIRLSNGQPHHLAKSTNELLGRIPDATGGKTGYTDKALGCFILVLKHSEPGTYFINVILGSKDRFGDMEKLIQLARKAQE